MYVPAFDPFHTIFRMLYILKRFDGNETIEVDRLRIYDFYLLFPYLANKISLKSDETQLKDSRRKFIPNKPIQLYIQQPSHLRAVASLPDDSLEPSGKLRTHRSRNATPAEGVSNRCR